MRILRIAPRTRKHDQTEVAFCGPDLSILAQLKAILGTSYYHISITRDVTGIESAVALKNGYALGIALTIGENQRRFGIDSELHFNSQAAVFSQCVREMKKLLAYQKADTLENLAIGLGDLYVTVYGGRTRKIGILLGRGMDIDAAKAALQGVTLESLVVAVRVARAVRKASSDGKLDAKDFPLLLHAHLFAHRTQVGFGAFDILSKDGDFAFCRYLQMVEAAEKGGFSRSGRTDDGHHVAPVDAGVQVFERNRIGIYFLQVLDMMSHDLRTPLNGIIGFTDIALKEKDVEKKQEYLGKIKSSGNLLLDLVNDTLDLSRIESGKMTLEPERTDFRTVGESVVTALRPSAELKDIRLYADPSGFPEGDILADRLKLQKIFLNLLSNAIKYTPRGGTVWASIEMMPEDGNGRNVRMTVRDTGIGISEGFLPKLFQPFSQEHRQETAPVNGTGLGLAIMTRQALCSAAR